MRKTKTTNDKAEELFTVIDNGMKYAGNWSMEIHWNREVMTQLALLLSKKNYEWEIETSSNKLLVFMST